MRGAPRDADQAPWCERRHQSCGFLPGMHLQLRKADHDQHEADERDDAGDRLVAGKAEARDEPVRSATLEGTKWIAKNTTNPITSTSMP
jgi:hypothetical protein